jgi:hypothetical protein
MRGLDHAAVITDGWYARGAPAAAEDRVILLKDTELRTHLAKALSLWRWLHRTWAAIMAIVLARTSIGTSKIGPDDRFGGHHALRVIDFSSTISFAPVPYSWRVGPPPPAPSRVTICVRAAARASE